MNATSPTPDPQANLIPRSLDPELPKSEGSPPTTERDPYKLVADDLPGDAIAPASAEDEANAMVEMVDEVIDRADHVSRKVPNDERPEIMKDADRSIHAPVASD